MYLHAPVDKIVFANINEFLECSAMPNGACASVEEYARSVVCGTDLAKISPVDMAGSIQKHADRADILLGELEAVSEEKEYRDTLADIRAMVQLGNYYSRKVSAAAELAIYRKNGDKNRQQAAVRNLKEAVRYWKAYSSMTVERYIPQVLTRLCGKVNVQEFDECTELDIRLAQEG